MADNTLQDVHVPGQAPWQTGAAYNVNWTYDYSNRATFYALVNPQYYNFMTRKVQHWLSWYDGYVPYFHNADNGIFSTHLATALVNRLADKVAGGQLMFKNAGKETSENKAIDFITTKWAPSVDFARTRNRAIRMAAAGGTSLLKANIDSKGIWAEALRFDSFIPSVDFRGNVVKVTCYLQQFTDMTASKNENNNYYLVEERYYGDYKGKFVTLKNVPLVRYRIHRTNGIIGQTAEVANLRTENIEFKRLPDNVKTALLKNFNTLRFDVPHLLPFKDWLGVELIKWTEGISNMPQLPFGESVLAPIISYLMTFDYYYSAFATDMYMGRGKVLLPKTMKEAKDGDNYNSGFDSFLYTQYPSSVRGAVNGEPEKPTPIQFELRAHEWQTNRDSIIQNIALNIGVNASTLAGFLQDGAPKTATEINTDENETASYINTQREILEKPFNRFLKHVLEYNGYSDEVQLRWSAAGLTNRSTLVNVLSTALQAGIISKQKAVEQFNYDDDSAQIAKELERIEADSQQRQAAIDSSNDLSGIFGLGDEH